MQGIERLALLSPLLLLAACKADWGPSPGGFAGGGTPYEGATPELLLDQPADGTTLGLTQDLAVLGRVSDADDAIEDLDFDLAIDGSEAAIDVSIVGENAWAATVALEVGTHELTFGVQDSRQNRDEVTVTVVKLEDQAPSDPVIGIAPQEPVSGQALFLSVVEDSVDPEGQHVSYQASWSVDGTELPDYDGDWEIPIGVVEIGQTWAATVVATDGTLYSNPVTTEVTVDGSGPAIEVDIQPEAPTQFDELVCSWNVYDPDGEEITSIEAEWQIDGASSGDATLPLANAFQPGDVVACEVVAVSSQENRANAQVTIQNTPPVVETVTLGGAPAREADTLSCSATGSDADGDSINFTYTWYVDGVATTLGSSLDGDDFDKGQEVYCSAVADDGSDSSAPLDSASTVIENTPPSEPVVELGPSPAFEGAVLSCATTTAATDPDPADSLVETWSWTLDGASTSVSTSTFNSYGVADGVEVACALEVSDGDDSTTAADSLELRARLDRSQHSGTADATIKGGTAQGYFGHTVVALDDMDGDGTSDLAVSGYGYDSDAGAVFVFSGADLSGTVQDDEAAYAFYGSAAGDQLGGIQGISAAGDVDGDGLADLLAAASLAGDNEHGQVYLLLSGDSGGWTWGQDVSSAASLVVTGDNAKDRLGEGLHASDLDGDGIVDFALGAPYEDTSANAAGAIAVFYGPVSGSVTLGDADVVLTGDASVDRLGAAVRGVGDVDGDGDADLLVSAQKADGGATDSGTAYILDTSSLTDGSVGAQATLTIEGEGEDDDFGISALGLGDLDGDGADDYLVGARFADVNTSGAGGVYFFYGDSSMTGTVDASSADAALGSTGDKDRLGWDMAAGDMDGDGWLEWTTGAYSDSYGSYTSAGRSYLMLSSGFEDWGWGDNINGASQARFDAYQSNMLSGRANAILGDVDGDGYGEWAVGAEGKDRGSKKRAGFVYLLYGP